MNGWSARRFSLILGPALFLACLLVPNSDFMVEAARSSGAVFPEGPKFGLGVLLWIACWWIGESTHLGLAALIPAALFGLSGLIPLKDLLVSFMDPLIWIFMSGFLFARAFKNWKLDERIALHLMNVSRSSNPAVSGFFVACLPVFLLTVTGSITASSSIVYGFVLSFLNRQGFSKDSRYGSATLLALGQASTAGALVFLTSTPPNLIAKRTILTATGFDLTFFDWFLVGSVHAVLGLLITWIITYSFIRPEISKLTLRGLSLEAELRRLPPMSRGEQLTILLLTLTVSLWMIPGIFAIGASITPSLAPISEMASRILPEAAPALLALLLLPLIKAEGRPLVGWNEALKEAINWDVIFLFGGGIALGTGLTKSGFSLWIAALLRESVGSAANEWMIFALSAMISFTITYPASNTGASSVACPLAATMATAAGVNPIPPILAAAIASSISSALPSTTPPMAIVYSSGYIRMRDMFKVGMICDLLRLLILIAVGLPLTKYFLSLRS